VILSSAFSIAEEGFFDCGKYIFAPINFFRIFHMSTHSDDEDIDGALRACFLVESVVAIEEPVAGEPSPVHETDSGLITDTTGQIYEQSPQLDLNEISTSVDSEKSISGFLVETDGDNEHPESVNAGVQDYSSLNGSSLEEAVNAYVTEAMAAIHSINESSGPITPSPPIDPPVTASKLHEMIVEEQLRISDLKTQLQQSKARRDNLLEEYKTLKAIVGSAPPTDNHLILLQRHSNETLGLSVSYEATRGGFLVTDVKTSGLIPEFNKTSPRPVKAGDVIIEVNGVSADKDRMIAEFKTSELTIKLLR
jgi:hypothetical protein